MCGRVWGGGCVVGCVEEGVWYGVGRRVSGRVLGGECVVGCGEEVVC